MEYAILIATVVVLVILVTLEKVIHHKTMHSIQQENEKYKKKVLILETANDFLKSTVNDLSKSVHNGSIKRALLVKENRDLQRKLDETNKKMQSLSKLINEIKNS